MTTRTLISLVVLSGSCAGLISCTHSDHAKSAASTPVALCVSSSGGTCTPDAPAAAPALTFTPIASASPAPMPAPPVASAPPASPASPAPSPGAGPTLLPGGFGFANPPRSSFSKAMGDIGQADSNLIEIEKAGWVATKTFTDPPSEAGKLIDLFRKLEQSDKAKSKPAEFAALLKKSGDQATALRDLLAAGNVDAKKASALLAAIGTSCSECHGKYQN